jgi:hypothetical protein
VLGLAAGVAAGSITNGRHAAKALGVENYLTRPATAQLLAALEYTESVRAATPPSERPRFGFVRNL